MSIYTDMQQRTRDILELGIAYAIILLAIWTPRPAQYVFYWSGFAWIIGSTLLAYPGRHALGIGLSGLGRSMWVVVLALFLSAAAIGVAEVRHTYHPLYGVVPVGWHLTGYLVWAFLQQFILQDYFLARLLRLLPSPTNAVFAAAGLFALAHLPNPVLTVATLFFGTAACFVFLRYRNLYTLGIAHFILGMTIAVTVSNAAHHHMRVGLGYLRYHVHHRALQTKGSAQPQPPDSVDSGVRDGGGSHAPVLPPSPAVEPSGDRRK